LFGAIRVVRSRAPLGRKRNQVHSAVSLLI
jgi:hypothetical protein